MKRLILAVALAIAPLLAACTPAGLAGVDVGVTAPETVQTASAPLALTARDEQALALAWETFDTALYSIEAMISTGVLVPGSTKALRVRAAVSAARTSLDVATDVSRTLNTPLTRLSPAAIAAKLEDYRAALQAAATAMREARTALQS